MNIEFGNPVKKKGYTDIPLISTNYDSVSKRKNAFLEAMEHKDLPKDLREWIYDFYIKEPITIQCPTFNIPFALNRSKSNIETINKNCMKDYSLTLKLDSQQESPDFNDFMSNMESFVKDYVNKK